MPRQSTLDALKKIPNGVWDAYLLALRGVNLAMGRFVLDDPTVCEELEKAIQEELGDHDQA